MNHEELHERALDGFTVHEGDALREAVLQYLRGEAARDLPDRELLVRATEGAPSWIDANGTLFVGSWQLEAAPDAPTLRFSLPPGDASMRVYVATLGRWGDAWRVTKLGVDHVLLAR